MDKKEIRISLDENDFQQLTGGKIIQKDNVKISLKDIGFENMKIIITGHQLKKYI